MSRLYYHDSSASLILGDSRSLAELPDHWVGLCLTSPPYYAKRNYGDGDRVQAHHKGLWKLRKGGNKVNEAEIGLGQTLPQYLRDLRLVFREVYRVLRPGGVFVLNLNKRRTKNGLVHDDFFALKQAKLVGFTHWDTAVFSRGNPQPTRSTLWLDEAWESVFILGKGRITVNKRAHRSNVVTGCSGCFGGNAHSDGSHGAVMPSAIADFAIRVFSQPGDIVLDPFLGWGTTLYRALRFGRKTIGVELYEKSILKTARRLQGGLDEETALRVVGQAVLW